MFRSLKLVYFIRFDWFNKDGTENVIWGKTANFPRRDEEYKNMKAFLTDKAYYSFVVETDDITRFETHMHQHFKDKRSESGKEWFAVNFNEVRTVAEEYCADESNKAKMVTFDNKSVRFPYNDDSRVMVNMEHIKSGQLTPKMDWRIKKIAQLIEDLNNTLTVGKLCKSFKHYRTDKDFAKNDIADVETSKAAKNYTMSDMRYDIRLGHLFVEIKYK